MFRHQVAVSVAIAGVLLGIIGWHIAAGRQENARMMFALSSGRELYSAAWQYALDHQGRYPDAARWEEQLRPYLPADFEFRTSESPVQRFAFNSRFSRRSMDSLTDKEEGQGILFYEVTGDTSSTPLGVGETPRNAPENWAYVLVSGGTYIHTGKL